MVWFYALDWFGYFVIRMGTFGYHDLGGFHSSAMVHGFLKSWLFRSFLWVDEFLGKLKFLCGIMLSIVMVVFVLANDDLWIS